MTACIRYLSAALPRINFIGVALLLILIAAFPAFAQKDNKAPAAFRDKLYDVQFVSDKEVFCLGYPGLILHSTDAGVTWEKIKIQTDEPFFAMDFIDPKTGWIVGRSGLIYNTTDGGKSWNKQETGLKEALFDVDFLDPLTGYVVGNFGTLLKTTDGGKTWVSSLLEIMASAAINSITMFDEQNGFIVGEYPLWETELSEEITEEHISNMFRTTNGGQTWVRIPTTVQKTLYCIVFQNDKVGYAAGNKGSLIMTQDGGETWTVQKTPYENVLMNFEISGDNIFITGTEGVLLKINESTVTQMDTKIFSWLCGISFGDENHGVLVGARGAILYTTDGGKSWIKQPIK